MHTKLIALLAVTVLLGATLAHAQTEASSAELAKKLQNPVASLISVPLQSNWDFGIGSANAMRYTLNVQPVIPFSLNAEWNLITRTIIPSSTQNRPSRAPTTRVGCGRHPSSRSSRTPRRPTRRSA